MRKEFEVPRCYIVEFRSRRMPRLIKDVVLLKTGKEIIFGYIAKDNQIHRHRYHNKVIAEYREITKEQYSEYKHQIIQLRKNNKEINSV